MSLANPTTFCHRISKHSSKSCNTLNAFSLVPPLQWGISRILVLAAAGMLSKQLTRMASRVSPFRSLPSYILLKSGPVSHHPTGGFVAYVAKQLYGLRCLRPLISECFGNAVAWKQYFYQVHEVVGYGRRELMLGHKLFKEYLRLWCGRTAGVSQRRTKSLVCVFAQVHNHIIDA